MKSPQRILSLDLGSTAFKLALLEFKEGRPLATQVRIIELPAQSDLKTREAALKNFLAGLDPAQMNQVISVVDDPFACLRLVSTPQMPASERTNAIRWQLQPFLAFPPEEAAIEYESVASVDENGGKLQWLAAAFPSAKIQEHLAFLAQAGIRPTQLVPKEAAIEAWFKKAEPQEIESGLAILDIGGFDCELIVYDRGRPVFVRKIPGGGSSLTKEMTGVLMSAQGQVSLTEAEAETFKRSVGIPNQADASGMEVKGVSGSQIFSLIRGSLERLAMEVGRSLAFYGESGAKISSLRLIGGGAHLRGLAAWLQERLGLPVFPSPALEKMETAPGAIQGNAAAVPLSLIPALGGALGLGQGLNLLPDEFKTHLGRQVQRVAAKGLLTAVVLGAVLLFIGMRISRQSLIRQINALRLEQQVAASEAAPIRISVAAHDQASDEPDLGTTLRWLSHSIPHEAYLTELAVEKRTVRLRGKVRRHSRPPEEALGEFMHLLEAGRMTQVRLHSSRVTDPAAGTLEFEISGELQ